MLVFLAERIIYGGTSRPMKRIKTETFLPIFFASSMLFASACSDSQPEFSSSTYAVETNCTDGVDDDADGLFDCADPECSMDAFCVTCGDGNLDAAETCDDGGTVAGDGCSSACALECGVEGSVNIGFGVDTDDAAGLYSLADVDTTTFTFVDLNGAGLVDMVATTDTDYQSANE